MFGAHQVYSVLGNANQIPHALFIECSNQLIYSGNGEITATLSDVQQAVLVDGYFLTLTQSPSGMILKLYAQQSYLSTQGNSTKQFDLRSISLPNTVTLPTGTSISQVSVTFGILYVYFSQTVQTKNISTVFRVNLDTLAVSSIVFDGNSAPLATQVRVMEDARYITLVARVDATPNPYLLASRVDASPLGLNSFKFTQTQSLTNLSLEGAPFATVNTLDFRNTTLTGMSALKWTQDVGNSPRNFSYFQMDATPDRTAVNQTLVCASDIVLKEETIVTQVCVLNTFAIFLMEDPTQKRASLRITEPRNSNSFDFNLKLMFGVTAALIHCTDAEVVVFGVSEAKTKVIVIKPSEYLRVQRRVVGYFELDTSQASNPVVSTSETKLSISFQSAKGASSAFNFWTVDRNGASKVYFRGDGSVREKNNSFPVALIQSLDSNLRSTFDLKIQIQMVPNSSKSGLLVYSGSPKLEDEKKYLYEPSPTTLQFNLEDSFIFNQAFHDTKFESGSANIHFLPRVSLLDALSWKQLTQPTDNDFCNFTAYGVQHFDLANDRLAVLGKSATGFCVSIFLITRNSSEGIQLTRTAKITRVVIAPEELFCSQISILRDKANGKLRNYLEKEFTNTFRILLYCKTAEDHVLNLYRAVDSSQAFPQTSLKTGGLKRFEAAIFRNRIFLCYLTLSGTMFYTKTLLSADQDSSIVAGVFNFFQGITSFDLMLDTKAASLAAIKVLLYNRDEKRLLLLEFSSNVDYSTRVVARTTDELSQVACADDFQTNVTCISKKSSGDVCLFHLMLSQNANPAPVELNCRIQNYYDFESESLGVLDSNFLFIYGQHTTRRFKGFLFYRVNSNQSLPVLASGSLDLNFTSASKTDRYSVSNSNSIFPGLLISIFNNDGLQFYQIRNMSLNVSSPDVNFQVSSEHNDRHWSARRSDWKC